MRRILLVVSAVAALLIGLTAPVAATPAPRAWTCSGGQFPANMTPVPGGMYSSLTVRGACVVLPGTVITVTGTINVMPGAVFDAQTFPSTITVGHNVTAGAGALLGLGCQPDRPGHTGHECGAQLPGSDDLVEDQDVDFDQDGACIPEQTNPFACASSSISVKGNVTTTGADTVLLNGSTVSGNVTLVGGGGDIPWSIKNNTIGRNLTASGITADWFGALFNHVGGNMTLINITATDPEEVAAGGTPPVYVVRNTIDRNLTCFGLGPALSFGFYPGQANTVGHRALGQCANPVS
jgi:phage baseplate assembly protein gpV